MLLEIFTQVARLPGCKVRREVNIATGNERGILNDKETQSVHSHIKRYLR